MTRVARRLFALLVAGWTSTCEAGDVPAPAPITEVIALRHCSMEFARTTVLGSSQSGVLGDCLVRPGDRVKAGQLLGRLRDDEIRVELELRIAEADNVLEIRAGEARHNLASLKLKTSGALNRRNLVSVEELGVHKLEAETAALTLEEARHRRRLAEISRRLVEASLRSREFACPHEGVVVEVLKSPGESVALNEPVFRVVDVGQVRVSGALDVSDAWQARVGQPVQVWPDIPGAELPIEREIFRGHVEFVDVRVSPDHQTCKVTVVVENRDGLLRAGLQARVEILAVDSTRPKVADQPKRVVPRLVDR